MSYSSHPRTLTGLLMLLFLASAGIQFSCGKVNDHNANVFFKGDSAMLTTFWFDPAKNPALLTDTVPMTINNTSITGHTPSYGSLSALIPSFTGRFAGISVNGVPQTSGVTPQNFTHPVTYAVTGQNGLVTSYTVTLTNFTGIPVMKITTSGGAPIVSEDDYINGHVSIDGMGAYPNFDGDMTIKGHGNSTWLMPKKPYHMKFGSKTAIFNENANKDWILLANYLDVTMLRNEVSLYMGSLSDLDWTPRSDFAELYLNNVYQGTYEVTESVDQSSTKVNITNQGYLVVIEPLSQVDSGDVYFTTTQTGLVFDIKNPNVALNDAQYTFIQNYLNETETALFGPNFTDTAVGYRQYLDVPSFVDWYLINEITKNNDAIFYASCYMNMAPGGKLKMGPIWDFDLALGNVSYNNNFDPTGLWVSRSSWMARLFQDTFFVHQVQQRFNYYNTKVNNFLSNIDSGASKLNLSVPANNNVWKTLGINIGSNPVVAATYSGEIQNLKNWLTTRMTWLQGTYAAMQ